MRRFGRAGADTARGCQAVVPERLVTASAPHVRRARALAGLGGATVLSVAALSLPGVEDSTLSRWFVDLAQVLLALAAALSCAGRARQREPSTVSWGLLAAACACWAAGQAIWSLEELVLSRPAPFPSFPDLGFLAFPVLVAVALAVTARRRGVADDRRLLLDGLIVACALGLLAWVTTLRTVVEDGTMGAGDLLIGLTYPVTDVALLAMTVVILSRRRAPDPPLARLALALGLLAVADSAFLYLVAVDSSSSLLASTGWCAGFLVLALAPLGRAVPSSSSSEQQTVTSPLPYLCLGVVTLVLAVASIARGAVSVLQDPVTAALTGLLLLLVLARQWTAVRENGRLVEVVRQREAELRHRAEHDTLTGLVNRTVFGDRLEAILAQQDRSPASFTVGFLDLDGFKTVNDTLGHAVGDELLVVVAGRLRGALRPGDTLARLGGDEFGVLLQRCHGAEAVALARRLAEQLRQAVQVGEHEVRVTASIGLADHRAGRGLPTGGMMLRHADIAMYTVKRTGKADVRLHAPGLRLQELDDHSMGGALRDALARREVTAVLQPIISLAGDTVSALEVLARWTHRGHEVPPVDFVAVAERTGQSAALTDLMLDHAVDQLARWHRRPEGCYVALGINVSPDELREGGLPRRVLAALSSRRVPASSLVLEITESALMRDVAAARRTMGHLRAHGVRFALDDFGTGYSSLSQVLSLPLDSVKIDRMFVDGIDSDPEQQRFLEGVLALMRHVDLRVVAEGVERPAQLCALRQMGVTWAQGHLLGCPMPAEHWDTHTTTDPVPLELPYGPVSASPQASIAASTPDRLRPRSVKA